MSWLQNFLSLMASILVIVSIFPLLRFDVWWIRAWDFPRVQVLVVGMLILLARLAVRYPMGRHEWVLYGLVGLALALHVGRIFPYTPLASKQSLVAESVDPDRTLSLMVANILMHNRQAHRLVDLVQEIQPDLLLVLEPDRWWAEQMAVLEESYPYRIEKPLEDTYGMMFYSRLKLLEPEIRYLMDPGVPSMFARAVLDSGEIVDLHLLHPKPPYPAESTETTERDAEILIAGLAAKASGFPAVVAGDLNDVAWSHTTRLFQRTSGMLDPRIGRGLYNTFHAEIPFMRWPLDHVFHSHHFKLVRIERPGAIGSDHFPVFVELVLDEQGPIHQEEPTPQGNDFEEVIDKLEEASDMSPDAEPEKPDPKPDEGKDRETS